MIDQPHGLGLVYLLELTGSHPPGCIALSEWATVPANCLLDTLSVSLLVLLALDASAVVARGSPDMGGPAD